MTVRSVTHIKMVALVLGAALAPQNASSSDINENVLVVTADAGANQLSIRQAVRGGNSAQILLDGSNALSSDQSWLRTTTTTLSPNSVIQDGTGLTSSLFASGVENQLSIMQVGSASDANLRVVGQGNMTAIQQIGRGNSASVTQTGHRNSVVISQ